MRIIRSLELANAGHVGYRLGDLAMLFSGSKSAIIWGRKRWNSKPVKLRMNAFAFVLFFFLCVKCKGTKVANNSTEHDVIVYRLTSWLQSLYFIGLFVCLCFNCNCDAIVPTNQVECHNIHAELAVASVLCCWESFFLIDRGLLSVSHLFGFW